MLMSVLAYLLAVGGCQACPEGVPGWILGEGGSCYHESIVSMTWYQSQQVYVQEGVNVCGGMIASLYCIVGLSIAGTWVGTC